MSRRPLTPADVLAAVYESRRQRSIAYRQPSPAVAEVTWKPVHRAYCVFCLEYGPAVQAARNVGLTEPIAFCAASIGEVLATTMPSPVELEPVLSAVELWMGDAQRADRTGGPLSAPEKCSVCGQKSSETILAGGIDGSLCRDCALAAAPVALDDATRAQFLAVEVEQARTELADLERIAKAGGGARLKEPPLALSIVRLASIDDEEIRRRLLNLVTAGG